MRDVGHEERPKRRGPGRPKGSAIRAASVHGNARKKTAISRNKVTYGEAHGWPCHPDHLAELVERGWGHQEAANALAYTKHQGVAPALRRLLEQASTGGKRALLPGATSSLQPRLEKIPDVVCEESDGEDSGEDLLGAQDEDEEDEEVPFDEADDESSLGKPTSAAQPEVSRPRSSRVVKRPNKDMPFQERKGQRPRTEVNRARGPRGHAPGQPGSALGVVPIAMQPTVAPVHVSPAAGHTTIDILSQIVSDPARFAQSIAASQGMVQRVPVPVAPQPQQQLQQLEYLRQPSPLLHTTSLATSSTEGASTLIAGMANAALPIGANNQLNNMALQNRFQMAHQQRIQQESVPPLQAQAASRPQDTGMMRFGMDVAQMMATGSQQASNQLGGLPPDSYLPPKYL